MDLQERFLKEIGVELVSSNADVEIGPWMTADGYEVHIITEDPRHLCWEHDVYFYKPSFDTILDYLKGLQYHGEIRLYVDDFEEYFDEYYMMDYLSSELDEEELEELGLL